jgi:hypothetical protein
MKNLGSSETSWGSSGFGYSAHSTTTIAVAEWESEELGKPSGPRYREWLRSSGIPKRLSLETYDGAVVVASRTEV